jgi:leader peptidase (prepilin peptidase)/N-methyltransferase
VTVVVILALALLGMIFGSFANAMVWRLHTQEAVRDKIAGLKEKKQTTARNKEIKQLQATLGPLSMSKGRSMCSNCRHPLAPQDLVPLISWLWLRGKCRYCHEPIQDTPWLEALLPVAFVLSYIFWPYEFGAGNGAAVDAYGSLAFGFWLIFLVGFAVLTIYDLRWQLLPDRVVRPLVAVAIVQVLLHAAMFSGGVTVLTDAFWGVVMASGIFYILYVASKGEWIGGGDVKLGIVLGLLVGGPLNGLLVLFVASSLGMLASVPQLMRHKLNRKSAIPFGPFLMAAACLVVLFGSRFTDWFNNFLLLG